MHSFHCQISPKRNGVYLFHLFIKLKGVPCEPARQRITEVQFIEITLFNPLTDILHFLKIPLFRNPRNESVDERAQSVLIRRSTVQDRKSTRLNSSHVAIAYAVFCFK